MINKALNICRAIIGEKLSVTDSEINNAIEQCLLIPLFSSIDKKQLHIELLRLYNVRQEEYKILFDKWDLVKQR